MGGQPDERFEALVGAVADRPGVTPPDAPGGHRFGSRALRVDGAIFAMLSGGRLVVKLPRDRVAGLTDQGVGEPFSAAGRTPWREWLALAGGDDATWRALTEEALAHVGRRPADPAAVP